jgi:hypothetical protein
VDELSVLLRPNISTHQYGDSVTHPTVGMTTPCYFAVGQRVGLMGSRVGTGPRECAGESLVSVFDSFVSFEVFHTGIRSIQF